MNLEEQQIRDDKIKHLKYRYRIALNANNTPMAEMYRSKLKELGVEAD